MGVPEPPEFEIVDQVPDAGSVAGEEYFGELGLGASASGAVWGGENQVESGQAKEQRLVLAEVGEVEKQVSPGGVAVGESDDGTKSEGVVRGGQEDRKTVDEVAPGVRGGSDSVIDPAGQSGEWKAHLTGEVIDFVGFGFEVIFVGMGEDEVQNHQPGVDHFRGLAPPVTEIILVDQVVNLAREEVVDVGVFGVGGSAGMAELKDFSGQAVHEGPWAVVGEVEILALREVAGVRGHEIEEVSLSVGITEVADGAQMLWADVHSQQILRLSNFVRSIQHSLPPSLLRTGERWLWDWFRRPCEASGAECNARLFTVKARQPGARFLPWRRKGAREFQPCDPAQ